MDNLFPPATATTQKGSSSGARETIACPGPTGGIKHQFGPFAMTNPERCIAHQFGSCQLDLERETLIGPDGGEFALRPKSFELLLLLVENAGRLVSQDRIMTTLWPDVYVTENNITQRIHEIRSALGPLAHEILRTRHGRGYMLAVSTVPVLTTEPEVQRQRSNDQGKPPHRAADGM